MSNHSRQSHSLGDQRAGQSVCCYQSVRMARLTQTSGSTSPQGQNGISLSFLGNSDGDAKKFTEITDMRTIRIMNEGVAITERLDCQQFPLFDVYQNTGTKIGLDNFPHGQVSRPQFDFKTENGIRTIRQFSSLLEMGPHGSGSREHVFEKVPQCFEEPATQMIPFRSNKGKAPQVSFMSTREKVKPLTLGSPSNEYLSNASMIGTKREHNHDLGFFSIMGYDKNWDDHSTSGKFETSFSSPCNAYFNGEPSKKMQNLPRTELLFNQTTSVKDAKSVNLSLEGCTFRKMPGCMLDMEAMETFNAKSLDGITGGQNTLSQTTHSLLYMENLKNNKNKQKPVIKESSDYTNSNRNMFTPLLSLSPPTGLGQRGVKIQLLDSSSDSQGKHDVRGILNPGVCQKNESSAETATMDMDTFKQQNNFYGPNSSTSNKSLSVGHDPPSQVTNASDRKRLDHKRARIILPDMNEIPVLQVSSSSMNTEPSTSRTQSLDAEHLLFDSNSPTNHKTSRFPNCPSAVEPITILEPSSRWLKRLKLSVPHSCGTGTKSPNVESVLSHRKVNKLFSKVIRGSDTCSLGQSFSNTYDKKDDIVANQSAIVLQKVESSYEDPPKKDVDILLSHSWIKRWCRDATQKKKLEAVVVCEPQSTKMDFGELQKKQCPSIGAMALMGKALNGFQPCEYQKKGSFVVWNTKGI